MERIGVRELRQNASRYLRLVKAGETVEITRRGTLIAVLAPQPAAGLREQLIATGELTPDNGQRLEDSTPLPAKPSERSLSEILQKMRDEAPRRNDALEALARCEQLALTDLLLEEAADIGPPTLRRLEAIHLASARRLPPEFTSVVTYDLAMLGAAATLDLPTASPV